MSSPFTQAGIYAACCDPVSDCTSGAMCNATNCKPTDADSAWQGNNASCSSITAFSTIKSTASSIAVAITMTKANFYQTCCDAPGALDATAQTAVKTALAVSGTAASYGTYNQAVSLATSDIALPTTASLGTDASSKLTVTLKSDAQVECTTTGIKVDAARAMGIANSADATAAVASGGKTWTLSCDHSTFSTTPCAKSGANTDATSTNAFATGSAIRTAIDNSLTSLIAQGVAVPNSVTVHIEMGCAARRQLGDGVGVRRLAAGTMSAPIVVGGVPASPQSPAATSYGFRNGGLVAAAMSVLALWV